MKLFLFLFCFYSLLASNNGHLDIVNALIIDHANLNLQNTYNETALMLGKIIFEIYFEFMK
jgi:hypothetical protein